MGIQRRIPGKRVFSRLNSFCTDKVVSDPGKPLAAIETCILVILAVIVIGTLVLLAVYHLTLRNYEEMTVNLFHSTAILVGAVLAMRGRWNAAMYIAGVGNLISTAGWLLLSHFQGISLSLPFGLDTYFIFQPIYLIIVGLLSAGIGPLVTINVVAVIFTAVFSIIGRPPEEVVQSLIAIYPLVYAIPAFMGFVIHFKKVDIGNIIHRQNIYLRESHLRMKNHIAFLSSIVSLQGEEGDFPQLKTKLVARLDAMATVQDQIHHAPVAGLIPLRKFIMQIIHGVNDDPWVGGGKILYRVESESINLPQSFGSRLGVILIELLMNAQKHAFSGRERGTVSFSASRTGHTVRLEYRDDGVGLPGGMDPEHTPSLGFALIREAVDDLKGTVSFKTSDNGLSVDVVFPDGE